MLKITCYSPVQRDKSELIKRALAASDPLTRVNNGMLFFSRHACLIRVPQRISILFTLQRNEQQQRGAARPGQHKDVRGSGTSRHGRERPEDDVRGVRPSAPDKHPAGQDHRQSQG